MCIIPMQIFSKLGIRMSPSEGAAFIASHSDNPELISRECILKVLLSERSRLLASELPVRKGAFTAGDFEGARSASKIVYAPCKTAVHTPSDWSETGAACIARSSTVPDSRLELDFVYGYDGMSNTSTNVFYNCQRQVSVICLWLDLPRPCLPDSMSTGPPIPCIWRCLCGLLSF
jgi:hypothetical protein